jgi:hypothetical protein
MNSLADDISALFEEVLSLATEEDSVCNDMQKFIEFVQEMLPPEVISQLRGITGSDDSDDTYLSDIWKDRFDYTTFADGNAEGDAEAGEGRWTERVCQICERYTKLTEHHLYPREMHKTMLKRGFVEEKLNQTASVCRLCHSTIHRFFSNKELADRYFTLDLLMEDERMQRFVKWASMQQQQRQFRVR